MWRLISEWRNLKQDSRPSKCRTDRAKLEFVAVGVVDTRADVHYYAVTEHGVAYLFGKSVRERARELIRIAHPRFREELTDWAVRAHYLPAHEALSVRSAA